MKITAAFALLLAAVGLSSLFASPASEISCAQRRKTKEPLCEDNPKCEFKGGRCTERNPQIYFSKDMQLSEAEQRFCRCVLKVMVSTTKNPYPICARSVGTSLRGPRDKRKCYYDWNAIADDQIVAYVRTLMKRGVHIESTRNALKAWYMSKKE